MKKLILAALLFVPSLASAQTIDEPSVVEKRTDTRVKFWSVDTGLRNTFVKDGAYDPYSTNDALTQWSLGGSRTVYTREQ